MSTRLIVLIITLLVIFAFKPMNAQTAGGMMYHEVTKDTEIVVHMRVFRICSGRMIISNAGFWTYFPIDSNGNVQSTKYVPRSFKKQVSIKTVSLACNGTVKNCIPANTFGGTQGIEEHYFRDTLKKSDSAFYQTLKYAIKYKKAIQIASAHDYRDLRYENYTRPLFGLTNFVYISNLLSCTNVENHSPEPLIQTPTYVGQFQNYIHTIGPMDPFNENDRIFVRHINGNSSIYIDTAVTYYAGSKLYYMPGYCIPQKLGLCAPKPKSNPPQGFYLDTNTGQVIYNTVVKGNFVNAMEILEFRRNAKNQLVRIGTSMYEAQYFIDSPSLANNAPVISVNDAYTVLLGDTLKYNIAITDAQHKNQSKADTVYCNWNGQHPNMSAKYVNANARNKTVAFSWAPDSTLLSPNPYRFNIFASDRYCPIPGAASKQILLYVKKKGSFLASIGKARCNRIPLTSSTSIANVKATWTIIDSASRTVYTSNKFNDTSSILQPGKVYIRLTLDHPEYGFYAFLDSLVLPSFPRVSLVPKQSICNQQPTLFQVKPTGFAGSTKVNMWTTVSSVLWDDSSDVSFTLDSNRSIIYVKASDSLNCAYFDSFSFVINPMPVYSLLKTPWICEGSDTLHLLQFVQQKDSLSIAFSANGNWVQDSVLYADRLSNQNKKQTVTVTLKTQMGCISHDSLEFSYQTKPHWVATDTSLCRNTAPIYFDDIISPDSLFVKNAVRIYAITAPTQTALNQCLKTSGLGRAFLFLGDGKSADFNGFYSFGISVQDKNSGCIWLDTQYVNVKPEPQFKSADNWCFGKPVQLDTLLFDDGNNVVTQSSWISYNKQPSATELMQYAIQNEQVSATTPHGQWEAFVTAKRDGCLLSDTLRLIIHQKPTADFTMVPDSLAVINSAYFEFTNTSFIPDEPAVYEWDAGVKASNAKSKNTNFSYLYDKSVAKYDVMLVSTTAKGCKDTVVKRVEVIDNIGTNSISNDWGFIDPSGVFQGKSAHFVKAWWYTTAGQRCFEQRENRAVTLPSGIYFVGLWIEENGVQRQVLVKVSFGN